MRGLQLARYWAARIIGYKLRGRLSRIPLMANLLPNSFIARLPYRPLALIAVTGLARVEFSHLASVQFFGLACVQFYRCYHPCNPFIALGIY